MTFVGATATAEGDTELTQLESTKVPRISVVETRVSASGVTGRSSHLEDLPSLIPRIGNISTCPDTLVFLASLLTLFN